MKLLIPFSYKSYVQFLPKIIIVFYIIPISAFLNSNHNFDDNENDDNGRFDIESFLDPRVIEDIIPLPVDLDQTKILGSAREQRQLSLKPTTAFISRRSFNTSCAFTIPLFTFTLPTTASLSGEGDYGW